MSGPDFSYEFDPSSTDGRWSKPPEGVRFYAHPRDFIAEDPSREATNGIEGDLDGWDVGIFRLEEPALQGFTLWRISIEAGGIYAVLKRWPHESLLTFDGPVWLIDTIPETHLPKRVVARFLDQVARHADDQDSLLLAVDWIRATMQVIRAFDFGWALTRLEDLKPPKPPELRAVTPPDN